MNTESRESARVDELYETVQAYIEPTTDPAAALFANVCCAKLLRDVSYEALMLGCILWESGTQALYARTPGVLCRGMVRGRAREGASCSPAVGPAVIDMAG